MSSLDCCLFRTLRMVQRIPSFIMILHTATATRDQTSAPRCTQSRPRRQVRSPLRAWWTLEDRGGSGWIAADLGGPPPGSRSTGRGPEPGEAGRARAPGQDWWGTRAPCRPRPASSGGFFQVTLNASRWGTNLRCTSSVPFN